MDGMMATQEKLKKGSEEINKMMDDMGQKRVRLLLTTVHTSSVHIGTDFVSLLILRDHNWNLKN